MVFDRGKNIIISEDVLTLKRDGQPMLLVTAKDVHVDSLIVRIKITLSCGVALEKQIQWAVIHKLSLYKEFVIENRVEINTAVSWPELKWIIWRVRGLLGISTSCFGVIGSVLVMVLYFLLDGKKWYTKSELTTRDLKNCTLFFKFVGDTSVHAAPLLIQTFGVQAQPLSLTQDQKAIAMAHLSQDRVLERSVSHDCLFGSLWERKNVSWLGVVCVLADCLFVGCSSAEQVFHGLFLRQQNSSSIWHRWRRKGELKEAKTRVKQRTATHEYMSVHGSTTAQVPVFAFSHLSARAPQRVQSSEPPELLEEVLWIHEAVLDVGYDDMGRRELLVQWQNHDSSATSWMLSKGFVCFYLAFKLEDKLVLQGESIDTIQGLIVGGKTPIEAEALLLSLRGSINREAELIYVFLCDL